MKPKSYSLVEGNQTIDVYWRGVSHPQDFFQKSNTLNSATKWLQVIVVSSFPVILAKQTNNKHPPTHTHTLTHTPHTHTPTNTGIPVRLFACVSPNSVQHHLCVFFISSVECIKVVVTFWANLSFKKILLSIFETFWAIMEVKSKNIYIFMEEIKCQKIKKYKENLSTKLLFLKNNEKARTTFIAFSRWYGSCLSFMCVYVCLAWLFFFSLVWLFLCACFTCVTFF